MHNDYFGMIEPFIFFMYHYFRQQSLLLERKKCTSLTETILNYQKYE